MSPWVFSLKDSAFLLSLNFPSSAFGRFMIWIPAANFYHTAFSNAVLSALWLSSSAAEGLLFQALLSSGNESVLHTQKTSLFSSLLLYRPLWREVFWVSNHFIKQEKIKFTHRPQYALYHTKITSNEQQWKGQNHKWCWDFHFFPTMHNAGYEGPGNEFQFRLVILI
jgi:hypothetical protein